MEEVGGCKRQEGRKEGRLRGRASYLALLHIHYDDDYDTVVDLDRVVDCYARVHPRRLELHSLLC